jgi:hypothetical protein
MIRITGFFRISISDFSNKLSLHVRIPNTNTGKNIKKRESMILKVLESNKNTINIRNELSKIYLASFENIIMKG